MFSFRRNLSEPQVKNSVNGKVCESCYPNKASQLGRAMVLSILLSKLLVYELSRLTRRPAPEARQPTYAQHNTKCVGEKVKEQPDDVKRSPAIAETEKSR